MKRMTFIGLVILLLAGAIGLSAVLIRRNLETGRELATLRLDPTRAAYFGEANRRLLPPSEGEGRIVYFGDSRIQSWAVLPAVPGARSVNRGYGGETTGQLLLRLDRDVIALAPRVAVLEMGINDLKTIGLFRDSAASITATCVRNSDRIIGQLRERGIHVIVLTVFPVGRVPLVRRPIWSDRTLEALNDVNRHLRALQGPDVTVVDCDSLFAQDGRMKPRYELDTLHLNEAGYAALSDLLRPTLVRIVARLGGRG